MKAGGGSFSCLIYEIIRIEKNKAYKLVTSKLKKYTDGNLTKF